ncbi:hypothetical protein AB1L88_05060 [Tautonia sp. JC769]|uniref:hypothetical protein n=1 Tax=Tautonia sp. JC769 TaxID=3232135 RepID=UPI003459BC01
MKPQAQPRLTLAQLLTIPVFAAAALACIVPAVRSNAIADYGIVQFLFLEGIIIPVAMALVAQIMLTRETGRDRLVSGLLWLSALIGRVALLALAAMAVWDLVLSVSTGRGLPLDLLAFLIVLVGGLIALDEVALFLRERFREARCPRCGHPVTTRDRPSTSVANAHDIRCPNCGLTIHRGRDD